jgi:hypothetical protein
MIRKTIFCDAGSRTARWAGGLKRVSKAVAVARRAPDRATRSGCATARQSSLACPFSKPHPRHAATARVPSAHASSAPAGKGMLAECGGARAGQGYREKNSFTW